LTSLPQADRFPVCDDLLSFSFWESFPLPVFLLFGFVLFVIPIPPFFFRALLPSVLTKVNGVSWVYHHKRGVLHGNWARSKNALDQSILGARMDWL
jgi:hypothetical protein